MTKSSFNRLYKEEIFKASTKEEGEKRKKKWKEIEKQEWIEKFKNRASVSLNPDGSYDSFLSVNMNYLELDKIPLKFNICHDNFYCSGNLLTSLENSPNTVFGSFSCSNNFLISLEEGPLRVNGRYCCFDNRLETLEGICGSFRSLDCSKNRLETLKPLDKEEIKRVMSFNCSNNHLTSLKGCPRIVYDDFDCSRNNLTSLEGCPSEVHGHFSCYSNVKNFTVEEVLDYCKAKGRIDV